MNEMAQIIDSDPAFRDLIRGWIWNARMSNGALFQIWTSDGELTRQEARRRILRNANGDYGDVYASADIRDLWRSRG